MQEQNKEQIKDGTRVFLDSALLTMLLRKNTAKEIKDLLHSIIEEQAKIPPDPRIVYLCDQKAACKDSVLCGNECYRTFDIKHAKNFELISGYYQEKESGTNGNVERNN